MWLKSIFDFALAILLLPVLFPIILILILMSSIDTGKIGLFTQKRIGQNGRPFLLFKIRSMKDIQSKSFPDSTRITSIGCFLRKNKLDEIPQIFNILFFQMSFVGPRPDLEGYADQLKGHDRIILSVKPGITGPAQLAFRNEEDLLSQQENPLEYNDRVIWPEKVEINKEYILNWSFKKDVYYLLKTISN